MKSKDIFCWSLLLICLLEPQYVSSQSETMKQFISMYAGIYSIDSSPIRPIGFKLSVKDVPTNINVHRAYLLEEMFLAGHNLTRVNLIEVLDSKNGIMLYRISPKWIWLYRNNFMYSERTLEKMTDTDVSNRSHCFFFEYVKHGHQFVSYETGCHSLRGGKLFNITYLELTCQKITFLQDVGTKTITVTLKKDISFKDSIEPRWFPDIEVCR